MNTNIKRWSVGSPIQAPLDGLLELIGEHKIKASDVEKLVVRVAHHSANTTDNRTMPDICMQYMCSVMLIDGTATFESAHDVKRMGDARVRELSKRIEVVGDDAITAARPARQGIVEIKLKDGRSLRKHVTAVRGTAQNPMTRAEVEEKAYDLMAPILGKARARKLCQRVWDLEKISDMRALRPLLKA
jgi:2-methylcitrate dehydratase PrpD